MRLWRCDICFELIDPAEGDERTVMSVRLDGPTGVSDESVDLCEDCRPTSLAAHMDWMTMGMEDDA
jgi:hypothetical protein